MENNRYKIKVWVGNLGKYNEGELVGDWFALPHDVSDMMQQIGVAPNTNYEEFEIMDYEKHPIVDLDYVTDLNALNRLATAFEELNDSQLEIVAKIINENLIGSYGEQKIMEAIDIVLRGEGEYYTLIDNADSYEDIARQHALDSGLISQSNQLFNLIDFKQFAEELDITSSHFRLSGNKWLQWIY